MMPDLNVDFYPNFLTSELAKQWYLYLESVIPHESRRNSLLFGDPGLIYSVTYRDNTTHREVTPWDYLPALPELKSLVEKVTEQKYTVCAMQRYANGSVGIAPHRDKEMVLGTRICGVSLGTTRTITFSKGNDLNVVPLSISLNSGSLYVMNPPTNQTRLHSIIKEPHVKGSRISLTFRDYRG
ncbi:2OG-Fe(II) oxygenase superfamily protein [uncultured virus]|nr:2OG-Fe(II) oxygenase superfamily protein [uncultured virus]